MWLLMEVDSFQILKSLVCLNKLSKKNKRIWLLSVDCLLHLYCFTQFPQVVVFFVLFFKLQRSLYLYVVFQYSPDNVQGPGSTEDPSEVTLPGCSCLSHSCCIDSCSCLQTHGQTYDSTGTLLNLNRTDSGFCSPVFECNALCTCSDDCSNRVVQRGLRFRLQVYKTQDRGWGVRTLEKISHGAFVCEYAGEVISFEEARRRQLAQRSEEDNYIIAVREHAGTGSVTETFVDPTQVGNVGRFLNHSCMPNLVMVPVRVHSVIPRLALFAGRDIEAQEELTFDYSGGYSNQRPAELLPMQSDAQARRTDGLQKKVCRCGSNNCTQFLPLDLSILSWNYHEHWGKITVKQETFSFSFLLFWCLLIHVFVFLKSSLIQLLVSTRQRSMLVAPWTQWAGWVMSVPISASFLFGPLSVCWPATVLMPSPTNCEMMQWKQEQLDSCWHSYLFFHLYNLFHVLGQACSQVIYSLIVIVLSWPISHTIHDSGRSSEVICTGRCERMMFNRFPFIVT